jgi:hypothetical protein
MTTKESPMNDMFDATRLHREELDREIETIRMERLLRGSSAPRPGFATRARTGLGRGFITVGTALLGSAEVSGRGGVKRSPATGVRA